jgi:hypothetical protein
MKLPNADKAIVPIEKLRDYCLNENHPTGKHKALVFRVALGMNHLNVYELKSVIENAVLNNAAYLCGKDKYGKRYYVDFVFRKFEKQAEIRTIWIIKAKEKIPRLITCYVKKKHS